MGGSGPRVHAGREKSTIPPRPRFVDSWDRVLTTALHESYYASVTERKVAKHPVLKREPRHDILYVISRGGEEQCSASLTQPSSLEELRKDGTGRVKKI